MNPQPPSSGGPGASGPSGSPGPQSQPGGRARIAAIKAKAQALDGRAQHQEWLGLTEVSGPFLTMPVLLQQWPQLDALDKEQRPRLRTRHADWRDDPAGRRDEWITYILRDLLEWGDALLMRDGDTEHADLDRLTLDVPDHRTHVRPDFALTQPGARLADEPDTESAAKRVRLLGLTVPAGAVPTARPRPANGRDGNADSAACASGASRPAGASAASGTGGNGPGEWAAAPTDRLARLLRHHGVPLGLVTDGRWWCLVWAPAGGVTTTALFDAIGWNEAAERNVVRAVISLLCRSRFFAYDEPETLAGLLAKSQEAGEEVTDALGVQVRQAVELLVDAIGRADAHAVAGGAQGLHSREVSAGEVYRAAVAVMMRLVFLLFAEERGLLPADNWVYGQAYSARFLRAELQARADDEGEAALEHTTSGWHRLIALFHAVHGGLDHPGAELELPAYDGSLFDPRQYPWLELDNPLLPIDDRTVLHMLRAVQEVSVGTGKQRETRTLSFRALGVEQIGYVYEGLLSYDGERAAEPMVGLIGPAGLEHKVTVAELESLATRSPDTKALAKKIHDRWKEPKPPASASALERLLAPPTSEQAAADARHLVDGATKDPALQERLAPFVGILRRDLRGLPVVMEAGALYVAASPLRRNTGTHYTPRRLAEEVVEHALEPLVYEPGPLKTADKTQWRRKSAQQILQLKVADIAMGSAAFLVSACRYLAERLIEAWEAEGRGDAAEYRAGRAVDAVNAADAEQEPVVIEARREIIEHCLYGADINPMAVEMAKLSLWLVSMDPERPFTFLDDRLVAGDSLLGVASMEQLQGLHLQPSRQVDWWADAVRDRVAQLTDKRLEISDIEGEDLEALQKKRAALDEVNEDAERLRLVGDLVVGAGLATCASGRVEWYRDDGGERVRDLFPDAAEAATAIAQAGVGEQTQGIREAWEMAGEWLASELPDGGMEREPVHWPLVFPEVFTERGGFDAVVGNPPFLGGQKLTGALGEAYREYLVDYLAGGKRGSADLVAYFALRAHELLNEGGQTGLVATNTLAQGDTREVGLDQLDAGGVTIRRAIKSEPWPSRSAVLEYCAVWTSKGNLAEGTVRKLGGMVVPRGITTALNPVTRQASWGEPLQPNSELAFIGSYVLGMGFTLSEEKAAAWIGSDERYRGILFPYLNGQDINTDPAHQTSRWVINFRNWTESRAREYAEAYEQVRREVKPERDQNKRRVRRERWWQFAERAPKLDEATGHLKQCIVLTLVSKSVMPVMVATGQVFSHKLAVFASEDPALLTVLSSAVHYWWAIDRSSTMKADLNYSPSDVFETLVRPPLIERPRKAGIRLDSHRRELMLSRDVGLTGTYNLVHDPHCHDTEIVELRRIHEEIDRATVEAYGWHDLLDESGETQPADPTHETHPLDHGFHETDQGTRYTIGMLARTEIIDRLRQLNHQAYADEVFLGLHKKPKQHPDMPNPSEEAKRLKAKGKVPGQQAGPVNFDDEETPPGAMF